MSCRSRHRSGRVARALVLLAAMAGLAAPAAAQSGDEVLRTWHAGKAWTISTVLAKGLFDGCEAVRTEAAAGGGIGLDASGWLLLAPGLTGHDPVPGRITLDDTGFDGDFWPGPRLAVWHVTRAQEDMLRRAGKVTLAPRGAAPLVLDLTGAEAAMKRVAECFAARGDKSAAAPAADKAGAAAPASAAPGPEAETAPGGATASAPLAAGVPDGVVVKPEKVAPLPPEGDPARPGPGCPDWGAYASSRTGPDAAAVFVNRTKGPVTVFLLDRRAAPQERAVVAAGESFRTKARQGQVWIARDASGACLGGGALFPVAGEKNRFVLK